MNLIGEERKGRLRRFSKQSQDELSVEQNPDYLKLILTSHVYDVAKETPLQQARTLSAKYGVNILLKREDLQPVFSFKIRGAYNKISHLSRAEQERGVIAVSAGNHAQGVAYAARTLGIPATIVMPRCTPSIKFKSVERMGARVILHGEDFDDAKEECARLMRELNLVNVPPYDDPLVIAGQGTVGMEIMRQAQRWQVEHLAHIRSPSSSSSSLKSSSAASALSSAFKASSLEEASGAISGGCSDEAVDSIFTAVGGGGLVAGLVAYIKRIHPKVKVIGVEAVDADAMYQSLKAGRRLTLDQVGLFADGAAVRVVGEETFRICMGSDDQPGIDEVVRVTNDEICAAIKDVFNDSRSVMEPAGALGVAGMKKWLSDNNVTSGTFMAVTSGANMNFDRLRFVSERACIGEEREALISVRIPEQPGSFMRLYECIHPRNVTEFSYRFNDPEWAKIIMAFEVDNLGSELSQVLQKLSGQGMQAEDLSHSELAKSHTRYLVGGSTDPPNQRLFQFTFPERPGALKKFLSGLRSGWNVSLFHYRNYGADVGKVLVGIQVPSSESEQFEKFLKDLNYPYREEFDYKNRLI